MYLRHFRDPKTPHKGAAAGPLMSLKCLEDIFKCPPDLLKTFVGPFRLARDIFLTFFWRTPGKARGTFV